MYGVNLMPILWVLWDKFLRIGAKVPSNKRLPELGELPGDLWRVLLDEAELSCVFDIAENGLDVREEE